MKKTLTRRMVCLLIACLLLGLSACGLHSQTPVGGAAAEAVHFSAPAARQETASAPEAAQLPMEGKEVTIVEMVDRLYPTGTLDNRTSVLRRVQEEGIRVMTATKVLEFTDGGIAVENADGRQELTADTCIIAMGTRPNAAAAKAILDRYVNAQMIGDCKKIGQVGEAVQSGFFAAWAID